MTPREGSQELRRGLSFEIAVGTSIRFGTGGYRVLSIEGHIRGVIPHEDPVALCRFGDQQRQPRQMQRRKIETGIQTQMSALRQRQRAGRRTIRPSSRRGIYSPRTSGIPIANAWLITPFSRSSNVINPPATENEDAEAPQ